MVMKTFLRVGSLWLALIATGLAAETTRNTDWRSLLPPSKNKILCDPVCELRSQDSAFSLLLEVFRQHQAYRIETDYQYRLQRIAEKQDHDSEFFIESNSEGLKMLRRFVYGLARQERGLRMVKLETQVSNLQAAYSCVRKIDEDYLGEKVAKNLDRRAAQEKIKDLVIIHPDTLAKGDVTHARTVPADLVLLNPPVGPANDNELVEPCD
jgi:hypothetical protein